MDDNGFNYVNNFRYASYNAICSDGYLNSACSRDNQNDNTIDKTNVIVDDSETPYDLSNWQNVKRDNVNNAKTDSDVSLDTEIDGKSGDCNFNIDNSSNHYGYCFNYN